MQNENNTELELPDDSEMPVENGVIQKLSYRHLYIAQLAAMGLSQTDICKATGYTNAWISQVINTPQMQTEVNRIRDTYFGANSERQFKRLLPKAISVAEEILDSPQTKDNLRADVAFRFMDRALGKPQQHIDMGGSVLADLYQRLDKIEHSDIAIKEIQAETIPVEEAQVIKDLDDADKKSTEDVYDRIDEIAEEICGGKKVDG